MKRIDSKDSVNGKFVEEDLTIGREGTIINAEFMNNVQEEIVNVATMGGAVLDEKQKDQMKQAINSRLAPIENEITAARQGLPTLTDRLSVANKLLPEFKYEILSEETTQGQLNYTAKVKCTLYWKGRTYRETIDVHINKYEAHWKILCFDPETERFEDKHWVKNELPLLIFKTFSVTTIAVWSAISLWNGYSELVGLGGHPDTKGIISDKVLFAWAPAGEGVNKDDKYLNILFCTEKFENCIIDMMGIPFHFQNTSSGLPMELTNCKIRGVVKPKRIEQANTTYQFAISGSGNYIELLDNTTIAFNTPSGNTVSVLKDTNDKYWETLYKNHGTKIYINNTKLTSYRLIKKINNGSALTYDTEYEFDCPLECFVKISGSIYQYWHGWSGSKNLRILNGISSWSCGIFYSQRHDVSGAGGYFRLVGSIKDNGIKTVKWYWQTDNGGYSNPNIKLEIYSY